MGILKWVSFWWAVLVLRRFSPNYIKAVYITLIEADLEEFQEAVPGVMVLATASFVHVKDVEDDLEFIIHEASKEKRRRLFVQEKTKKEILHIINGKPFKSPWEEVYREGVHATRIDFVTSLKKLTSRQYEIAPTAKQLPEQPL